LQGGHFRVKAVVHWRKKEKGGRKKGEEKGQAARRTDIRLKEKERKERGEEKSQKTGEKHMCKSPALERRKRSPSVFVHGLSQRGEKEKKRKGRKEKKKRGDLRGETNMPPTEANLFTGKEKKERKKKEGGKKRRTDGRQGGRRYKSSSSCLSGMASVLLHVDLGIEKREKKKEREGGPRGGNVVALLLFLFLPSQKRKNKEKKLVESEKIR